MQLYWLRWLTWNFYKYQHMLLLLLLTTTATAFIVICNLMSSDKPRIAISKHGDSRMCHAPGSVNNLLHTKYTQLVLIRHISRLSVHLQYAAILQHISMWQKGKPFSVHAAVWLIFWTCCTLNCDSRGSAWQAQGIVEEHLSSRRGGDKSLEKSRCRQERLSINVLHCIKPSR